MPSGTVTSYVIQYATDSAFKQNVRTKTVTGQNGKAPGTSTTLSGLTKRRTYYIRIQAVNGAVSSPWSSAITVYTP
jgi:phosphodiesterase/alkaline phosphatase D-like protein